MSPGAPTGKKKSKLPDVTVYNEAVVKRTMIQVLEE